MYLLLLLIETSYTLQSFKIVFFPFNVEAFLENCFIQVIELFL